MRVRFVLRLPVRHERLSCLPWWFAPPRWNDKAHTVPTEKHTEPREVAISSRKPQVLTCSRCQGDHANRDCPTLLEKKQKRKRKLGTKVKPWKPASIPPAPMSSLEHLYTMMFPLIRRRIFRRLLDAPESRRDEMFGEACAFSWKEFCRVMNKGGYDWEAAARIAAYSASETAKTGRRFCSTRQGGYVDAMDSRIKREEVDMGLFPSPYGMPEAPPPKGDVEDMTRVLALVADMPPDLKTLAICLGANSSMKQIIRASIADKVPVKSGNLEQTEIAAYMDCSIRKIQYYVADLRDHLTGGDSSRASLTALLSDWLADYPG